MFREFTAHSCDLSVLSRGDRSLRVMIVARTNCKPLDKRLLICHFLNRRRPKIFGRNVLLSFYKRLVFNVLQVSVIHILDYIMSIPADWNFSIFLCSMFLVPAFVLRCFVFRVSCSSVSVPSSFFVFQYSAFRVSVFLLPSFAVPM